MSHRIEWVDVLKGLAILLVVIGHGFVGVTNNKMLNSYFLYPQLMMDMKNFIYSFHMPLFFLVAGAFAGHWVKLPAFKAFEKKVWRLGYPYFFWGGYHSLCHGISQRGYQWRPGHS